MTNKQNLLIVILGPTAVGKTKIAADLAFRYHTHVVSADSRQVFKELRIGTARPDEETLSQVPHHFIASKSVTDEYNAGKYETETIALLEELFKTSNPVIMAGGTGLYIKAVCEGFDELPSADTAIRASIQNQYEQKGISALQEQIQTLDPLYYSTADIHNPQRLMRALEVCMVTGFPYSAFREGKKTERPFAVLKIGLEMNRDALYARINQRVDEMFDAGLVEEVGALVPFRSCNALRTVGYTEVFDYLEGNISLEDCKELVKQNTRRYAKRQLTWFRRDNEINWFDVSETGSIFEFVQSRVNKGEESGNV